jgi:hypothetical protein
VRGALVSDSEASALPYISLTRCQDENKPCARGRHVVRLLPARSEAVPHALQQFRSLMLEDIHSIVSSVSWDMLSEPRRHPDSGGCR